MDENKEKEKWEKPQYAQLLVNERTKYGPNAGEDYLERES